MLYNYKSTSLSQVQNTCNYSTTIGQNWGLKIPHLPLFGLEKKQNMKVLKVNSFLIEPTVSHSK
jgi:hypothetical protein